MSDVIAPDVVVVMTFVVAEVDGEVLDNAWAEEPYAYIHGRQQMPEGFERGVEGLRAGEVFEFDVSRELAYGEHNSQLVQKVAVDQLPPGLSPGMVVKMAIAGLEGAPLLFHVASIRDGVARLDGNHPFAGKDLRFMGKIRQVRPATPRELATGRISRQ